jgi:hypothetical protein
MGARNYVRGFAAAFGALGLAAGSQSALGAASRALLMGERPEPTETIEFSVSNERALLVMILVLLIASAARRPRRAHIV